MVFNIREALLTSLLNRTRPIEDILNDLSELTFDSDPLIPLRPEHLISVLDDYLAGIADAESVERWANAVEVRDDLFYEGDNGEIVKEMVFDLANPRLSGALTAETADQMKSTLLTSTRR